MKGSKQDLPTQKKQKKGRKDETKKARLTNIHKRRKGEKEIKRRIEEKGLIQEDKMEKTRERKK